MATSFSPLLGVLILGCPAAELVGQFCCWLLIGLPGQWD